MIQSSPTLRCVAGELLVHFIGVVEMRIAIVDDEAEERARIRKLLGGYSEQNGIPFEITEFSLGINFISDYTHPYDIVFMDISMPHMDGIVCARQLREIDHNVVLIFITRMAQYALQGYDVDALDFMVKPVDEFRLFLKLNKAVSIAKKRSQKLSVVSEGKTIVLSLEDILYVEGSNQYVYFHTMEDRYRVHSTLKDVESRLGSGFARCNNSFIVNLNRVNKASAKEVFIAGRQLPVSRTRKKEFLDSLNRFLGGVEV